MNREQFDVHEQDFRFFRTSCGLIGFILFFVGSFLAFIISGELDNYSQLAFILGGVSLFLTLAFFFCVMHESKRTILPRSSDGMEMIPLINQQQSNVRQPEPELPLEPQPEPHSEIHWGDKTRHDFKYVRSILGLPSGDSDETVQSENDPDSDLEALQRMRNSGSSDGYQVVIREPSYDSIDSRTYKLKPNPTYGSTEISPCESKPNLVYETIENRTCEYKPNLLYELKPNLVPAPLSETSKTSQDLEGESGSIGSGSFDVELHSRNARTSIVDESSSEITDSRPDISPLQGLFLLSSSDSTKSGSNSSEKQTENVLPKRQSSTDSEVKSENQHVLNSEEAKSDNLSKSE